MNSLQSLSGSSLEQFIDGHENENVMKKTNYNVALFLEFLVLKGEIRQIMDKYHVLIPQELNKEYGRGIRAQFPILNFRRTISTYFQDALFYSN